MLGLSRRESADATIGWIDNLLASLVDRLAHCEDPFDRLRLSEAIDAHLDRRLDAMAERRR